MVLYVIVVPSLSRYNKCATNPYRKKVKEVSDYEKLLFEHSNQNVADNEKKEKREDRHQNRFNYYNAVIATLALILSIISILLQVC